MSAHAQHPTALVETDQIGEGTRIWAFVHVLPGAVIGPDCKIGDHVFVETGAVLGRGVTVKNNALVWKGVHLGDYVFVGPGVVFTNDIRPRSAQLVSRGMPERPEAEWLAETFVEEGASIGANATILAGIRIGAYAMIGAGSVVTKTVAPYTLVAGNPARVRGRVDAAGHVLRARGDLWVDPATGKTYRVVGEALEECAPGA